MKPKIEVQAGNILRLKRADVAVDGGIANLSAQPGRQLVVLVLGVSDGGSFDVEPMLRALGYVPEKMLDDLIESLAKENPNKH